MFKYIFFYIVLVNFQFIKTENVVNQKNFNISEHENYSDNEKQSVTEYFNNYWLKQLPAFDLTISDTITPKCRLHSEEYQQELQNLTLWALKMYDASAKIPLGILSGNLNQYGNFDECLNTHSDNGEISGQYCMADIEIMEPNSKYLRELHSLIYAHFPMRSGINDPGHTAPRWSSIFWAVCVPASCSHEDVEIGIKNTLKSFQEKSGISLKIRVFNESCQTAENEISWATILIGFLLTIFIGFVFIITLIDYFLQYPLDNIHGMHGILLAFSLRRTLRNVFSLDRPKDDIECVHGVRFFNMILIYLIHKSLGVLFAGFVNRTDLTEAMSSSVSIPGRAVYLLTDTFLMLSGMLSAYSYFGRKNRGTQIHLKDEYISRLIRIIPPMMAMVLFVGFFQPHIGSGPKWKSIVTHSAKLCQNYWWRNLLFIQNYFGEEVMCLPHSHHIGSEMQLFLVSPLFFWTLWKWKKLGIMMLLAAAIWSTVLRFNVMYYNDYSVSFHFGASIKQLYAGINNMYIIPTHRATSYLIGALLGYYLRNIPKMTIKPAVLNTGQTAAIILLCLSMYEPTLMSQKSYKHNSIDEAWFAAFGSITWCLFWAWIIFSDYSGNRNMFTKFLSWPGFLITTRISYAVYLTQLPIILQNAASTRASEHFQFSTVMYNFHEFGCIIIASLVLTLLFETPFETIKKICLKRYENKLNN
ncbi:nose resistant to fluoxetine protein 6-like [Chrysoperla carnea]|uniref:nose resistant to fluoxetine protein 6-like n=1 Tax=Chrysoperla carnea TaxID=189513 RepID=UPI001D07D1BB|nr:nose resistant to fluoxetine protein 6-like [Chrysoperla carnea]